MYTFSFTLCERLYLHTYKILVLTYICTGKTFTMMGSNPECPSEVTENAGLYVLAARDIFRSLSLTRHSALQLYVSCFEIYGGKLYDLLNERNPIKVNLLLVYTY